MQSLLNLSEQDLLFFIVLLPLCGALLNAFVFRKMSIKVVCALATIVVAIPFVFSVILFLNQLQASHSVPLTLFNWLTVTLDYSPQSTNLISIPFAFTLDRLSSLFLLVITGVGTLIHLYSGGYMAHDKDAPYRFFVYLNLFIFSMLVLVLGSNMLVTFLGWEGVGVCSYLLVGYWYEERPNSIAAIKAFVVNRIGDAGFIIAMFLCFTLFRTINYAGISAVISSLPPSFFVDHSLILTLIGLSLFLAVTGKSAQIPLYTWLPDAMAGPTPVSALIHAATMVTAGIYLMSRASFLLVLSPVVMTTIASVGAATAFFSATIALAQTDIKKVLAYSTCSQLGYMVMACGMGAFQYGIAHVITHAFFKACLFLCAGSVILALHHEQDFRKMGGLFKKMPLTAVAFCIATLAIIGFPGFSGFFSKDAILGAAWHAPFGNPILWFFGWITAGLTAFYMLRLTVLVFFGKCRADHPEHIHENNMVITVPLILLALFAVLSGAIALPEVFTGRTDFITDFLNPIFAPAHANIIALGKVAHEVSSSFELSVMLYSVTIVIIGALFAILIYRKGPEGGEKFARDFGRLYRLVRDKWRVDELYDFIFVRPLAVLGKYLYSFIDRFLIDGIVNGVPQTLYIGTTVASDAKAGIARNYLKLIFVSIVIFTLVMFF